MGRIFDRSSQVWALDSFDGQATSFTRADKMAAQLELYRSSIDRIPAEATVNLRAFANHLLSTLTMTPEEVRNSSAALLQKLLNIPVAETEEQAAESRSIWSLLLHRRDTRRSIDYRRRHCSRSFRKFNFPQESSPHQQSTTSRVERTGVLGMVQGVRWKRGGLSVGARQRPQSLSAKDLRSLGHT